MAARAKSVHSPVLSRIDGARSATIDVQDDGHEVDVDVGQLNVDDVKPELEIDVEDDEVVLGDVLKLEAVDEVDDDDDEIVLKPNVDELKPDDDIVVDAEVAVLSVELTDPDVDDDGIDCPAQDDCGEYDPAKYTFNRVEPPHTSAVFPLQGM